MKRIVVFCFGDGDAVGQRIGIGEERGTNT